MIIHNSLIDKIFCKLPKSLRNSILIGIIFYNDTNRKVHELRDCTCQRQINCRFKMNKWTSTDERLCSKRLAFWQFFGDLIDILHRTPKHKHCHFCCVCRPNRIISCLFNWCQTYSNYMHHTEGIFIILCQYNLAIVL